jgi:hypothetical protein
LISEQRNEYLFSDLPLTNLSQYVFIYSSACKQVGADRRESNREQAWTAKAIMEAGMSAANEKIGQRPCQTKKRTKCIFFIDASSIFTALVVRGTARVIPPLMQQAADNS